MIYTVTFSPSLDYVMTLDRLETGGINRARHEEIYPGGKGVNVSIMLARLGEDNVALGFTAGYTGHMLKEMLSGRIATDFVELPSGQTRINVKLRAGDETAVNGQGPDITAESLDALFKKLDGIAEGDSLVLAGAIPASLPCDVYERILTRLAGKGVNFTVDATKELLKKSLAHRPFLIKPNKEELGEIFGVDIKNRSELVRCAKEARHLGARNVLVSLDASGALLVTENDDVIVGRAPQGSLVNSVGAGDSMVAGFLVGYNRTGSYTKAMTLGLAAGSATAFSEWLAEKEFIKSLLDKPEDFGF